MAEIGGDLTIEHLAPSSRFTLSVHGQPAVVLEYVDRPGAWDIVRTYADPRFRGTGVASQLVQQVFDEARSAGLRIIPSCPYIPVWVSRHPDQADLIGPGLIGPGLIGPGLIGPGLIGPGLIGMGG